MISSRSGNQLLLVQTCTMILFPWLINSLRIMRANTSVSFLTMKQTFGAMLSDIIFLKPSKLITVLFC